MRSRSSWTARATTLVMAILCANFAALPVAAEGQEAQELVLLNWSEFMDPKLVAKFEQSHNALIRQVFFETNQARDQNLVESDGKGYDLAVVNDIALAPYRDRGWLAPLDRTNAPSLEHIDPRWYKFYAAAEGYAAPYFWGTLGIAYRADLVPYAITSWKQFFEPDEVLRHKIATTGDPADIVGMALKTLGYSANSITSAELAAAEGMLLKQKPFVHSHRYLSLGEKSALVTGEIFASMIFNGDALMVMEHEANIKFVVPEERQQSLGRLSGCARKVRQEGLGSCVRELSQRT